ncbi:MAG: PRC-barrel domain-containing protein [Dehalococcoidales bacterium]|nr:PRC-barrel domain-containing protein [Dehalococcoidales bacterium]
MEHDQDNPLLEETYYHDDLISLEVRTTSGDIIGFVTEILTNLGNDNFIVRGPDGDILIPLIEDVIVDIDLEEKIITIEPFEGLLDLNKKKPRD